MGASRGLDQLIVEQVIGHEALAVDRAAIELTTCTPNQLVTSGKVTAWTVNPQEC